jgi:salicylate hydroxylase
MPKTRRIIVVGAGLGGLAATVGLRRRGFEVEVYEQSPELGEIGAGINITPN